MAYPIGLSSLKRKESAEVQENLRLDYELLQSVEKARRTFPSHVGGDRRSPSPEPTDRSEWRLFQGLEDSTPISSSSSSSSAPVEVTAARVNQVQPLNRNQAEVYAEAYNNRCRDFNAIFQPWGLLFGNYAVYVPPELMEFEPVFKFWENRFRVKTFNEKLHAKVFEPVQDRSFKVLFSTIKDYFLVDYSSSKAKHPGLNKFRELNVKLRIFMQSETNPQVKRAYEILLSLVAQRLEQLHR